MHKIFQNISPFLIGSNLTDKWTPTEKPWGRGCVISYVIAELLPKKHSKKGRIQLDGWHLPFTTSPPGKCFRLVSELRKTEERDFSVLAARKMEPEPKWAVFESPGYVCKRFFPFFPPPGLLAPLFRAVFDSRSSFVCFETVRKRLLRRLDHNSKAKESSINPIQTWGSGAGRLLRFSIPHGFKVE